MGRTEYFIHIGTVAEELGFTNIKITFANGSFSEEWCGEEWWEHISESFQLRGGGTESWSVTDRRCPVTTCRGGHPEL